jgi:hypothetical protein
MYGQKETIRGATRRFSADAGGSQGSTSEGKESAKSAKNKDEEIKEGHQRASKASEAHTQKESQAARLLNASAGLKPFVETRPR